MSHKPIDAAHLSAKHIPKTDSELLRELLLDIDRLQHLRGHSDARDISRHPSYSQFRVPYFMVCGNRYRNSRKRYNRQFRHELQKLIDQLRSAFEVARLIRHTSVTTLWPPYHTRLEIEKSRNYFHCFTQKEQNRLRFLMSTNII